MISYFLLIAVAFLELSQGTSRCFNRLTKVCMSVQAMKISKNYKNYAYDDHLNLMCAKVHIDFACHTGRFIIDKKPLDSHFVTHTW